MGIMRGVFLLLAVAVVFAAGIAYADEVPSRPDEPSGCASWNAYTPFDVRVLQSRDWGVVPFRDDFGLTVTVGSDSILSVEWDFDGDGFADTTGLNPSHVFTEPTEQQVVARITTATSGTLTRSVTVEAYSAIMSITFDDGQESIYGNAYPLLASKGVTATVYLVPTWINGGWYLSWDDVTELAAGGWDIGSHSLTHQNLTQVDSVTLDYELSQSKVVLQAHGFEARNFSVPFGACSWTIIRAAKRYYQSCRGWKGLNPRLEQTDPYLLMWDVTAAWLPLTYYKQQMDSVMTYGGWYILNNHLVYDDCGGQATCVDIQMLSDIIDYAQEKRMKILNVDQALAVRGSGGTLYTPPGDNTVRPARLELWTDQALVSAFPVTIRFSASRHMAVDLGIYDVAGRVVRNLASSNSAEGEQSVFWDGLNQQGVRVSNGCYFCVLRSSGDLHVTRKLVVLR